MISLSSARRAGLILVLSTSLLTIGAGCTPDGPGGSANGGGGGGGGGFTFFTPQPPKPVEPPRPDPQSVWPPRAVWVSRFELGNYRTPEAIAALMDKIKGAGLNTVLLQVRGNGTSYYRSSIEPIAWDPGFDPLEVACREAHRRGLAVQAWVNVMPGWRGKEPPKETNQLYNAHPDWFWYDQNGKRQPLGGFYVSVNPCLPEVRRYLVSVFEEIVRKYPIDGLHLDYIRFPNEESPRGSDYPYDAKTLALYKRATGKRPQDDKNAWSQWRTQQVTQLVREIRDMTRYARPGTRLTASVGADAQWRTQYFQDGPTWLRNKLVDNVFVMNYSNNTKTFTDRQEKWFRSAPRTWVAAGISVADHLKAGKPNVTIEQLRLAHKWGHGFSLFSAGALLQDTPASQQIVQALRSMNAGAAAAAY
jgi:uncharacterized lipoprotein YddW (UPF0748 family)